jgi:Fur family ferric uptake transcriptional regulator
MRHGRTLKPSRHGHNPSLDKFHSLTYGRGMAGATEVLREHGVTVTAQRLAVLTAVSRLPHATADEVADAARAEIGVISRQSVYDTLRLLVEAGLVRRIQPIGSAARYEDRVGDNHHHVICRECGSLADIDCAVGTAPCLTASDDRGFVIDEADVAYWGRCPDCQLTFDQRITERGQNGK